QPQLIEQNNQVIQQFKEDNKEKFQPSVLLNFYLKSVSFYVMIPALLSVLSFVITLKFYENRQPEREKIIEQIHTLSEKLVKK
ncbi:MAG: hypothetical protein AABW88_03245, partial [Nanoarchaeota archaeon]